MSVARVHVVKSARKDQGECGGCKRPLQKGDGYKWWTIGFRSRRKYKRCLDCPTPPPSARESNEKVAAILSAEETFEDSVSAAVNTDEVRQALLDCAEALEQAGELYEEACSNIEDGFGHETELSAELREKGEGCCEWADTIRSFADDDVREEDDELSLADIIEDARSAVYDNEIEY